MLHLSASFAETENRVRGLEGGADGYLTYPVEPTKLLANVQALLRVREAERQVREQQRAAARYPEQHWRRRDRDGQSGPGNFP